MVQFLSSCELKLVLSRPFYPGSVFYATLLYFLFAKLTSRFISIVPLFNVSLDANIFFQHSHCCMPCVAPT